MKDQTDPASNPETLPPVPVRFNFGYHHGMSQPSTTLSFSMQNPAADWDLTVLDNHLHNILDVVALELPDVGRFCDGDK